MSDRDVRAHSKDAALSLSRAALCARRASQSQKKRAPFVRVALVAGGAFLLTGVLVYLRGQRD